MMRTAATLLCIAACSSATSPKVTPKLEVTSPARGSTVSGGSVTVAGTATGDATLSVDVMGKQVPVAKDGTFSAVVQVPPGISVIETHAHDKAGDDIRDTRAVLAGTLGTSDGSTGAPIGARASSAAIAKIADAVSADANAINWTAEVQPLNPVYHTTGCFSATISITSVSLSDVAVSLAPTTGSLQAGVSLNNLDVKLHADFSVLCIGGSTTITVTASSAKFAADLGVDVSSGALQVSVANDSVQLNGFNLNVGGVPSQIASLFDSVVQGKVQGALQSAIKSKVPPIANAKLATMLGKPFHAQVLGMDTAIDLYPTTADLTPAGLYVEVSTWVTVTGGTAGMYLVTPAQDAATLTTSTRGLGVAIAADVPNQLLAGLWAAGAFDKTIQVSSLPILGAVLDPDATQLVVKLSLPPTVSVDGSGNLQLALGDALISVQNASGSELQKIALSLQTGLAANPAQNGEISLQIGTPTTYAQVLGQVDDGSRPLTDQQVEGIVNGAWNIVSQDASGALGKLPMPKLLGIPLGAPTIDAQAGFVLADVPVQ